MANNYQLNEHICRQKKKKSIKIPYSYFFFPSLLITLFFSFSLPTNILRTIWGLLTWTQNPPFASGKNLTTKRKKKKKIQPKKVEKKIGLVYLLEYIMPTPSLLGCIAYCQTTFIFIFFENILSNYFNYVKVLWYFIIVIV